MILLPEFNLRGISSEFQWYHTDSHKIDENFIYNVIGIFMFSNEFFPQK